MYGSSARSRAIMQLLFWNITHMYNVVSPWLGAYSRLQEKPWCTTHPSRPITSGANGNHQIQR